MVKYATLEAGDDVMTCNSRTADQDFSVDKNLQRIIQTIVNDFGGSTQAFFDTLKRENAGPDLEQQRAEAHVAKKLSKRV